MPCSSLRGFCKLGHFIDPDIQAASSTQRPASKVQLPTGGHFIFKECHAVVVEEQIELLYGGFIVFQSQENDRNAEESNEQTSSADIFNHGLFLHSLYRSHINA
jgi:hypothetical protein